MLITEISKPSRPIKAVQFGGGVFLRGFFDWMLCKANSEGYNGNVVVIRAKTHGTDPLAAQNYMYTHIARDGENYDASLIDCIETSLNPADDGKAFLELARTPELELIVSNTTEAGIAYEKCELNLNALPLSYPARLTVFLYTRYQASLNGLLILPCELIEQNGDILHKYVLQHAEDWNLEKEFIAWLEEKCSFRNTLVDRIVSGASDEKFDLEYVDNAVNTSEFFHLWVIEGKKDDRLPFDFHGNNIKWVEDVNEYRTLKVRILNGAHTSMIPFALNRGVLTVGDCMKDGTLRKHLEGCLYDEIIPSLGEDKREEALNYAKSVIKRFENPYICHRCAAISLNSVSKFKVRVLPSILEYKKKFNAYPKKLVFSLAQLILFYKEGTPNDAPEIMEFMKNATVKEILCDKELWGISISELEGDITNILESE